MQHSEILSDNHESKLAILVIGKNRKYNLCTAACLGLQELCFLALEMKVMLLVPQNMVIQKLQNHQNTCLILMFTLEVLTYSKKESSSSENCNSSSDISACSLSVKILGTPTKLRDG